MKKAKLVSTTLLLVIVAMGLALLMPFAMAVTASASGTITEYPVPTPSSQPTDITTGPDGNLWFTEAHVNKIGKLTTSGSFTEYPVPTPDSMPGVIITGPDDNLWFTEVNGNKIGKLTTSGTFTEYPVPTSNSGPGFITTGPDDNLWFTEGYGNKIGTITTSGSITEYLVPTFNCQPFDITTGPDGNLWFTEYTGNKIGEVTTSGTFTEYIIPTTGSGPFRITTGPDGNLWFTEALANQMGEITTSGSAEAASTEKGRTAATSTTITEYPVPTSNSQPYGITAGPDSNIWFTERESNKIGEMQLGPQAAPTVSSISPNSGVSGLVVSVTLTGTGFQAGATVHFENSYYLEEATNVNVVSDTQITCQLPLYFVSPLGPAGGLPLGKCDVVVANPDGQEATLSNGFSVTNICGGGAAISLSVFGLMMGLMSLAGSTGLRRRFRRKK